MSHLLDVNFLVACAWETHPQHDRADRWLSHATSFATCTAVEMGFLRVSLSAAYSADFAIATAALGSIVEKREHRFLQDAIRARSLPHVRNSRDVTDAHLVNLARRYKLKLATFDAALCLKEWARGIAEDPTQAAHRT